MLFFHQKYLRYLQLLYFFRYKNKGVRNRESTPRCPGLVPSPQPTLSIDFGASKKASVSPSSNANLSKAARKNLKRKEQRQKKKEDEFLHDVVKQYESSSSNKSLNNVNEELSNLNIQSPQSEMEIKAKKIKGIKKKLRQIESLKQKIESGEIENPDQTQLEKIEKQSVLEEELKTLENES